MSNLIKLNGIEQAQTKLLLIDDDKPMSQTLHEYLTEHDFSTKAVHHPQDALRVLKQCHFDLILLDLMLPEIDGLALLKVIRQEHDTPIIMVTAKGELSDKVLGLEIGADDYVAKPFEPRELVARIKSVIRRHEPIPKRKDRLIFNAISRLISVGDLIIELTEVEVELFRCLEENEGKAVSRAFLYAQIKGVGGHIEIETRAVDHAISRLRKKLSEISGYHQYIQTVRGKGYLFIQESK